MLLDRRLLPGLVLAVGVTPLLTACGLFDRGSTLDDALEYVPSDTYEVHFVDQGAYAERLGFDDLDPRDLSDSDVDDVVEAVLGEGRDAAALSELTKWVATMADAPLNGLDVDLEIRATWGEPDRGASATVWKVGDEVDFDDLADDLVAKGYERQSGGESAIYTIDLAAFDDASGLAGGTYPLAMQNVLLAEDEQVVAATIGSPDPLTDVSEVISDDADSLADADDDRLDELLDAVDDPELAEIATAGSAVCPPVRGRLPQDQRALVDALGRPDARALFVHEEDDEARVTSALRYPDEAAAEDAVGPREAFIADGRDLATGRPLTDLGDFDVEQDDALLLIDQDWEGGTAQALTAEQRGAGPAVCGVER